MRKIIILKICLVLNISCYAYKVKTNDHLTHLKKLIFHVNDTLYINTYQLTIKEIDSLITAISIVGDNNLQDVNTTLSILGSVNNPENDSKTKYKLLTRRITVDQDKTPDFSPLCGNIMHPRKKYSSQKEAIATYITNLNDLNFSNALYLFDGFPMQPMEGKLKKKKFLKKLRKTKILKMTVLPREQGISIYGIAAKNGLILIHSEKK